MLSRTAPISAAGHAGEFPAWPEPGRCARRCAAFAAPAPQRPQSEAPCQQLVFLVACVPSPMNLVLLLSYLKEPKLRSQPYKRAERKRTHPIEVLTADTR